MGTRMQFFNDADKFSKVAEFPLILRGPSRLTLSKSLVKSVRRQDKLLLSSKAAEEKHTKRSEIFFVQRCENLEQPLSQLQRNSLPEHF